MSLEQFSQTEYLKGKKEWMNVNCDKIDCNTLTVRNSFISPGVFFSLYATGLTDPGGVSTIPFGTDSYVFEWRDRNPPTRVSNNGFIFDTPLNRFMTTTVAGYYLISIGTDFIGPPSVASDSGKFMGIQAARNGFSTYVNCTIRQLVGASTPGFGCFSVGKSTIAYVPAGAEISFNLAGSFGAPQTGFLYNVSMTAQLIDGVTPLSLSDQLIAEEQLASAAVALKPPSLMRQNSSFLVRQKLSAPPEKRLVDEVTPISDKLLEESAAVSLKSSSLMRQNSSFLIRQKLSAPPEKQ